MSSKRVIDVIFLAVDVLFGIVRDCFFVGLNSHRNHQNIRLEDDSHEFKWYANIDCHCFIISFGISPDIGAFSCQLLLLCENCRFSNRTRNLCKGDKTSVRSVSCDLVAILFEVMFVLLQGGFKLLYFLLYLLAPIRTVGRQLLLVF